MIAEIRTAFSGKSVLITGHTGFKGAWLSLWLKRLGAKVIGYALEPPTDPSCFQVAKVCDYLDSHIIGDIRDFEQLQSVVARFRPDYVFHLAAQTVVKTGYLFPRETFDVNVTGTACVLDAVRTLDAPCSVVCVTSDKCYANDDQRLTPFTETDALGERDPYGASKGGTELVVRAYQHSFFPTNDLSKHEVRLASARAGNVIGGGDWTPHALLPALVSAAINSSDVQLRFPQAVRPWQHVLQTLGGYLLLAARLAGPDAERYIGAWNFGPDPQIHTTVSEFAEQFFRAWGSGAWSHDRSETHKPEAHWLGLSIDKARDEMGWKPSWDLQATIERTVKWFKAFHEGHSAAQLCLQDIEVFEASLASDSSS